MPDPVDVTKQPLPWSVLFPGSVGGSAVPDMGDAAGTPPGFRVGSARNPATCRHEGNPHGYTWCKHCGTRLTP